jgi:hypothetical protein
METITKQDIQNSTKINPKAKQWALLNLEYLNKIKGFSIFGTSTKVEKGGDKFDTYILYLQPADKVAVQTLCAFAEKAGCKKPCLIESGRLLMDMCQDAATKRTVLMLLRPDWFNTQLLAEIDKAERKAQKAGGTPALFRLNGTSDIDFTHIITARPNSQFYDYTKIISRMRKNTLSNYDLTFSASMASIQSKKAFKTAMSRKYKTAIAFNTKGSRGDSDLIPTKMYSFDKTDLRHLDPVGTIGALKRKGSNIVERIADNQNQNSFFVTDANYTEFKDIIAVGG